MFNTKKIKKYHRITTYLSTNTEKLMYIYFFSAVYNRYNILKYVGNYLHLIL